MYIERLGRYEPTRLCRGTYSPSCLQETSLPPEQGALNMSRDIGTSLPSSVSPPPSWFGTWRQTLRGAVHTRCRYQVTLRAGRG